MNGHLRAILSDPGEFYESPVADRLAYSAAVVLLTGFVSLIGGLALFLKAQETLSEAPRLVMVVWVLTIVAIPLGAVVSWFVYAVLFHGISKWYETDTPFRTTLTYVGWGFYPQVISAGANAVLVVVTVSGLTFPDSVTQLGPFISDHTSGPLFTGIAFLSIVTTFWSAILWTFAMKQAHDLSTKSAVYIIALPVALGVLYQVYSIL